MFSTTVKHRITRMDPCDGILAAIGATPLVRLGRLFDVPFALYAKMEGHNPGGSLKDRAALEIIRDGMQRGNIREGTTIVESSSGNMAIGLAQACSYFHLRFIAVVDPKINRQTVAILRAYGAEIDEITEPDRETGDFLTARIARVRALLTSIEDSYWPNQYANLSNAAAHYRTMREITFALRGKVDYLFCATSTCGTLRGCAEFVRANGLATTIVAVDAVGSVIFGASGGRRLIPGHGSARRPELFVEGLAGRSMQVSDIECIAGCRSLLKREAILAGGSSGAIVAGVSRFAGEIPPGSNCVLLLCDRGERYLDTVYSDTWVTEHFGAVPRELMSAEVPK